MIQRDRIAALPRWAKVALAGRCAQVLAESFDQESAGTEIEAFRPTVAGGAKFSAAVAAEPDSAYRVPIVMAPFKGSPPGSRFDLALPAHLVSAAAHAARAIGLPKATSAALGVSIAAEAAVLAKGNLRPLKPLQPTGFGVLDNPFTSVDDATHYVTTVTHGVVPLFVEEALAQLESYAHSERWTDDTGVPPEFFLLTTKFDIDEYAGKGRTIIELSSWLQDALLAFFRKNPEELKRLPPRRFEELIAELMAREGYVVELTAQSRDGGFDIVAVRDAPATIKFLLECKRWDTTPVGVKVVRALMGVVESEGAHKGILVTTSRFTQAAGATIERNKRMIEGKNLTDLVGWLESLNARRISDAVRCGRRP